jgi:hypothetical protein
VFEKAVEGSAEKANLFTHFASDVGQALFAVEALSYESTIAQHLDDLSVF